jgi:hypothetical protein
VVPKFKLHRNSLTLKKKSPDPLQLEDAEKKLSDFSCTEILISKQQTANSKQQTANSKQQT